MAEGKNLDDAVHAFREVRPGADTIVVCDDTEPLLRMFARTIKRLTSNLGVTVETFQGAPEALELVRSNANKILFVLSDRDMGPSSMVGEAFANTIRVELEDDTTPFLMATGGEINNPLIHEAFARGCIDGLLQKPFDIAMLAPAIAAAITVRLEKVKVLASLEA